LKAEGKTPRAEKKKRPTFFVLEGNKIQQGRKRDEKKQETRTTRKPTHLAFVPVRRERGARNTALTQSTISPARIYLIEEGKRKVKEQNTSR